VVPSTDFVTVFEITRWSNGLLADTLFRLLVGVVALIGGATALISIWRKPGVLQWRNLFPLLFLVAWAVLWLAMHDFPRVFRHIDHLAEAYERGGYEIAEGIVTVLHQQPAHGHSSGDRITVDRKPFEVNYFYATPAYRQTIAHGGALQQGTYARLSHVDGEIVRVEIRR
jgi:hypothetical protein